MTNPEVEVFVNLIFDQIKKAKTINDLNIILSDFKFQKNRIKTEIYPKIEFDISVEEIEKLISDEILDSNHKLSKNFSLEKSDTITKILYALAWKNGDLQKINHIITGVLSAKNKEFENSESLVFHQFGRHLSNRQDEPIIDQHVIRAFCAYRNYEYINIIEKKHFSHINEYKSWLVSEDINLELRSEKDYVYFIDQILFALGKTIKNAK